jgi:hypothetical protein
VPDVANETINSTTEFVVLASDGLWSVLTSQQVGGANRCELFSALEEPVCELSPVRKACFCVWTLDAKRCLMGCLTICVAGGKPHSRQAPGAPEPGDGGARCHTSCAGLGLDR